MIFNFYKQHALIMLQATPYTETNLKMVASKLPGFISVNNHF